MGCFGFFYEIDQPVTATSGDRRGSGEDIVSYVSGPRETDSRVPELRLGGGRGEIVQRGPRGKRLYWGSGWVPKERRRGCHRCTAMA